MDWLLSAEGLAVVAEDRLLTRGGREAQPALLHAVAHPLVQHGELEGIQPKVLMLMIGTNNSNGTDNSADEIVDGVKAIVGEVHKLSPLSRRTSLPCLTRKYVRCYDSCWPRRRNGPDPS